MSSNVKHSEPRLSHLYQERMFIHKLEVSYASQCTFSKLIVTYYYQTTQY